MCVRAFFLSLYQNAIPIIWILYICTWWLMITFYNFFLVIIFPHIISVTTRPKVEYIQLFGIIWSQWYRVIKYQFTIWYTLMNHVVQPIRENFSHDTVQVWTRLNTFNIPCVPKFIRLVSRWSGGNQADWPISNLLFYGWTEMKPDGFDNNMKKFRNTRIIVTMVFFFSQIH